MEKLEINREKVKAEFKNYTDHYDTTDEKVKLKIGHTYRVADLCERIAKSEGMNENETDLAWLLGMLHDVGRFEQLKRFGTFIDAESIDHAALGADILFGSAKETGTAVPHIRDYIKESGVDSLIETAVRVHSAYRIPADLDDGMKKFCNILRDADKIDILKVNIEVPLEEIYNTTTTELRNAVVTKAVMQSFFEHHAVLRSLKKTPADQNGNCQGMK